MPNKLTTVEDADDRIIYVDDFSYTSYTATIEPNGAEQPTPVDDQGSEIENIQSGIR